MIRVAFCGAALVSAACAADVAGSLGSGTKRAQASATPASSGTPGPGGQVGSGSGGGSPTPGQTGAPGATDTPAAGSTRSPTPVPSAGSSAATATPTPSPSATPTETPVTGPKVLALQVSPATASLGVTPAEAGATPLQPTSVQVTAEVTYTNGSRNASVSWSSSDTAVAAVSSQGLVTAGGKGGTVTIKATSVDSTLDGGKAEGTCLVTVKAVGDVDLTVE